MHLGLSLGRHRVLPISHDYLEIEIRMTDTPGRSRYLRMEGRGRSRYLAIIRGLKLGWQTRDTLDRYLAIHDMEMGARVADTGCSRYLAVIWGLSPGWQTHGTIYQSLAEELDINSPELTRKGDTWGACFLRCQSVLPLPLWCCVYTVLYQTAPCHKWTAKNCCPGNSSSCIS